MAHFSFRRVGSVFAPARPLARSEAAPPDGGDSHLGDRRVATHRSQHVGAQVVDNLRKVVASVVAIYRAAVCFSLKGGHRRVAPTNLALGGSKPTAPGFPPALLKELRSHLDPAS
jgi:hypothetical protein